MNHLKIIKILNYITFKYIKCEFHFYFFNLINKLFKDIKY